MASARGGGKSDLRVYRAAAAVYHARMTKPIVVGTDLRDPGVQEVD
jgi:hypothetical protein